jgi:hypothetical protein
MRWKVEKVEKSESLAYPIDRAFEVIGVTRTAGYELIAKGILKTYRVGRRRNASRRACEEAVAHMEREGQAA